MATSIEATVVPSTTDGQRRSAERELSAQYQRIRQQTDRLCGPLSAEDCVIQSMPEASPVRWHLAHTTWFFETFVLKQAVSDYQPVDPAFEYLFNSYYNQVGKQFPRAQRGLLSRPGLDEVKLYRETVDVRIVELLSDDRELDKGILQNIELGLQHEQQHQELILTDVKHMLSCNPLWPAYHVPTLPEQQTPAALEWIPGAEGICTMGYAGNDFAYDNEGPVHEVLIQLHELASRLVTNGEYLEFIEDGGYQRPEHWLSLGWNTVGEQQWTAPLNWHQIDGQWCEFTLAGLEPLDLTAPVCHVSFFEGDAYARWRGVRLPTEAEWEQAATAPTVEMDGNFMESDLYHPAPAGPTGGMQQLFGDVWEWTASPYTPYPGYRPAAGAIGEYNGKFMCNQYVLRGGSCATSASHIRPTYRNFFPPDARWQFTGIRLAR